MNQCERGRSAEESLYRRVDSQAEIARLEARLNDEAFLTKAPATIVDKERDRLAVIKDKQERLKQQLSRLQS